MESLVHLAVLAETDIYSMELRMVEAAAAETEHILLVLLDQWLLHTVEQVVVAVEEAKDLVLTVQQIPEVAVAGVVQAEH
jgi:hypothetical protein